MNRFSRLLVVFASLIMLGAYALPLWKIQLVAPQYPEGLGMYIRLHALTGATEFDLGNINKLNHYIGMKAIDPDSIPELRIMPWILAALIVAGILIAILGRRRLLNAWLIAFITLGITGIADFWRWGYDYGHNLDREVAVIEVPGMTYQPPMIGSKQLLNFRATSWPASGSWLLGIAVGLGVLASFLDSRRERGARVAGSPRSRVVFPGAAGSAVSMKRRAFLITLALAMPAIAIGCTSSGPRALVVGEDSCAYCRMRIADTRFGGEIVTGTGKVLTFDSIECLSSYRLGLDDAEAQVFVSDFARPGVLLPAESAWFRRAGPGVTPMGQGWIATSSSQQASESVRWRDVLERARTLRSGDSTAFATATRAPAR